jgi:hypothetical protein
MPIKGLLCSLNLESTIETYNDIKHCTDTFLSVLSNLNCEQVSHDMNL